ncbi:MAG: long-chain fatty acid--CoA ligase [Gemmatimonadetes bacterium]|nr:long-chain fatty acid--CoA ligase [Gemmatimonadota bacterium]
MVKIKAREETERGAVKTTPQRESTQRNAEIGHFQRPRTVPELFRVAADRYGSRDFMRYKVSGEYVSIPAQEFRQEVDLAACGLIALGVEPGARVALLSENRPGWAFADLAILSAGAWTVPIYTSLTPDEVQYILADSGAVACFVSNEAQLAKVREVRGRCPALRYVIALDPIEAEGVVTARALVERGQAERAARTGALEERLAAIDPEDTASILYTSGTTGRPKGVILTHANFVSNTIDSLTALAITSTDTHLSFLPLSHSFERTAGYYIMIYAGVTIAYAESIDTVSVNMAEVHPTVMTSVPRLYEKMYAGVLQKASEAGGLEKWIAFWARRVGIEYAERRTGGGRVGPLLALQQRLADRIVFAKIRERTGGGLRFFVSGGAPLAPVIAKFFYAAGIPILEGYGLTETSPVIAVNRLDRIRFGTVGQPIPNVEVRIEPDPERPDGDGEILVRGPNVMRGYYNLPDKTAEVMTDDGWFRTGDIGHLDADGFLAITDRKKDLIKTSGGKYIVPQPLENELKTSKFVSQAVVVGNKRKHASVLIVPSFDNLEAWAREHGVETGDREALLEDQSVQALYQGVLDDLNARRASYGTLKKFRLLADDFTIGAGELTPTLKVKRRVIEEKHAGRIDTMYEEAVPAV